MRFVFVDDDGVTLQSVKPCPVSKAFVDDFTVRCKSCAYTVSCLDCGVELLDSGSLQDHMLLFEQTHVLTSRSIVSKVKTKNNFVLKRFLNYAFTRHTFLYIWDCRKPFIFFLLCKKHIYCVIFLHCFFSILHLNY